MAHHKRRKRTFGRKGGDYRHKNYVCRSQGVAGRQLWLFGYANVRQQLKSLIWDGWE